MVFKVGPFTLYRSACKTLSITLTALDSWPFGWEYGWEDKMANRYPWFQIRMGKLMVFSFEAWKKKGFELWFMGFWWIA